MSESARAYAPYALASALADLYLAGLVVLSLRSLHSLFNPGGEPTAPFLLVLAMGALLIPLKRAALGQARKHPRFPDLRERPWSVLGAAQNAILPTLLVPLIILNAQGIAPSLLIGALVGSVAPIAARRAARTADRQAIITSATRCAPTLLIGTVAGLAVEPAHFITGSLLGGVLTASPLALWEIMRRGHDQVRDTILIFGDEREV